MKIYILIEGGLGNQLFQAAFGRLLQKYYSSDISFISITGSSKIKRICELEKFGYEVSYLSSIGGWFVKLLIAILGRRPFSIVAKSLILREDRVDLQNMPKKKPMLVFGYWQNLNLIGVAIEELRDIYLKSISIDDAKALCYLNENHVAIHIRRGDYVSQPETAQKHLVCTLDYYQNAWKAIASEKPKKIIAVFSDDIPWVKKNIKFDLPVIYIESELDQPAWIDLFRMASCGDYIISNSTYSWWAAMLGQKPSSIIIAPEHWFNGVETSSMNLIPSHWRILSMN